MVARLLEVRSRFSVVFLTLKSRNFTLLLLFFCHKLNLISGEIRLWRKCWVYKTTSSIQLNCNCQHSIARKILLSKVNRKTLFWMLWSLFLPSKKWTLGFCRILKGSYSKKDWQQPGIRTQFFSVCTLTHPSFYHLFLCIKGCYK